MSLLIVTATLGRSEFLRETVESVRRFAPVARHVLVAPADEVAVLRSSFPDLEVRVEQLAGIYPAVNLALDSVESWDLATWLNDDDRLEAGFTDVVDRAGRLSSAKPWTVYGDVTYIDENGRDLGRMPTARPWCVPVLLAEGRAAFSQQGAVFSREFWRATGGFDEQWRLVADHDLWLRASQQGGRFVRTSSVVASFRIHDRQLTSDQKMVARELRLICSGSRCEAGSAMRLASRLVSRMESLPRVFERRRKSGVWTSHALYLRSRSSRVSPPVLIHPLTSSSPTGIGVAASGLTELLVPDQAREALKLNRWFRWINDRMIGGPLRLIARMGTAQISPFVERGGRLMVFTSHHAPLWKTDRHVVIIYDLIAIHHPNQARMQNVFFRLLLPRVLKSASRIVTISGAVRDELRQKFEFLEQREIDVIPAYSKALQVPMEKSVERSPRHVLVVGARYPHKNLGLVLDAMALMVEQGCGERLVVAGIRRELWSDRDSWRRLEEEGLLETLDFPLDLELRQLYEGAHCLVYPSFDEGQGLPPLEALRHGCPVICSDIPVLRETCGQASFFVDPRDSAALAPLLTQICRGEREAEIDEMRPAASEILDRFSGSEIVKRWTTLLETLS